MVKQEATDAVNSWSNSFLRPLIPPDLLKNSKELSSKNEGAKLIYAKFYYGEQTGAFRLRPFDGGFGNVISDLREESLWLYSLEQEKIPEGFEARSYDGGIIRTGKVQKCHDCRGHGHVTCRSCKGRIRWTEKIGDRWVEKVCSCGNGKELCRDCKGFGEMETIIEVKKKFKLYETKNAQYKGEVPEKKIRSITGSVIFEECIEYPAESVKKMLAGGIDANEYRELTGQVLSILHKSVDQNLEGKDVNTVTIHEQLDTMFASIPNPATENKLMEREIMPIRVMVRVEDAPVTQVDYVFRDKNYSLWVYGNENKVWCKNAPSTFNYKVIVLLVALGATGIIAMLSGLGII